MRRRDPNKRVAYTQAEVARMTGRDRSAVRRWIDRGLLETFNIPGSHRMVTAASVERLMRSEARQARQ